MKMSDQPEMQSKYVNASDITGEVDLRVSKVTREQVDPDDATKTKTVVFFEGRTKGLPLNVTNIKTMVAAYGDESDSWTGRPVVLYVIETNFEGKMGVRIRIPAQSASPAPQPQPAATAAQPTTTAPQDEPSVPDDVRFPEATSERYDEDMPF